MDIIGKSIKDLNKAACSTNGLLLGFCEPSLSGKNKNYLLIIGISLFVQYILPVIVLLIVIPILIGNMIGLTLVTILSSINPLYLLGLIPIIAIDVGFVAVFIIASFVITIAYWLYYLREIGILAIIPVLMWILSLVLSFIPYVGNLLSAIISITPWMAVAGVAHWFFYKNDGKIGLIDLAP